MTGTSGFTHAGWEGRAGESVLIVSSEFPPGPGGIGTHAHQVATGLQGEGWRVLVVTSQDYAQESEVAAFNRAQPFRVVRFRPVAGSAFEGLYRAFVLNQWIERHGPRVLIASGGRSILLAATRFAGRALPLVAIGHGTEFTAKGTLKTAAVRKAFGRSTAVVCVSQFTRDQMHSCGIHPRTECVIPNGADPERFRVLSRVETDPLRRELGLTGARLLVTVGNVSGRKGQDIVVRALPAIRDRFPNVHYALAGLPTMGPEIQRLADELGVGDRVHLLGRLDDDRLVRLLNAADVFVMTSRRTKDGDVEGYGIAVIESALCGRPAVVTTGSGLSEAIVHGETGFCVPPDDPGATALAIRSLLEDDVLRERMGEAARVRAEREQTWARRVTEYDSLLRKLVAVQLPGSGVSGQVPPSSDR